MNFQELNYALSIARYQNLTKAAEELYISQPTLSKCLQKLEREMGGKLFSRSGNTYVPTYLGRRYLEYARKVLALNQDWERELKDMNACMDGELNIAFPLMRSSCMVPSIMKVFHKKYPGVRVNFMEEAHAIQEKLLLNDELDFGIFNETRPHPKLSYETLLREEILLVMPPNHPMAGRGIKRSEMKHLWMDLRLLEKEEFILHFPDQTTGQLALELFETWGIKPQVSVRTRNTETSVRLCMEGMGLCFVPETYIKNMHFDTPPACFTVGEKGVFSTLTIASRKGAYLPSYAQDFIKIAQEQL
ncbi:MAG TPA: LysR family transcriptional regulator [Candidatus Anaerobutyricum avicola]|nr:LysR family transcriptional regulator [Candidatus Anaerobutyricum avicola]